MIKQASVLRELELPKTSCLASFVYLPNLKSPIFSYCFLKTSVLWPSFEASKESPAGQKNAIGGRPFGKLTFQKRPFQKSFLRQNSLMQTLRGREVPGLEHLWGGRSWGLGFPEAEPRKSLTDGQINPILRRSLSGQDGGEYKEGSDEEKQGIPIPLLCVLAWDCGHLDYSRVYSMGSVNSRTSKAKEKGCLCSSCQGEKSTDFYHVPKRD